MKIEAQPFDVMQYFYSFVQPPLIRCYIRFTEKIDQESLSIALNNLLTSCPILQCVYHAEKKEWIESSFCKDDYLMIIAAGTDQKKIEMEQLMSSLLIGTDPPIRIFLVCGKDHDTICIIGSHLVCDGRGFEQLIYLLSKYYSLAKDHTTTSDDSETICGRRDFRQITQKFSVGEKIKILCSKSMVSSGNTRKSIPLTGKNGNPTILKRTIPSAMFSGIHSFVKAQNASINDAILTAYARALHQQFGWKDIVLPSPVDLRRFGEESVSDCVCNLTGNYYCNVQIEPNESYEVTLKKVSVQMKKQKAGSECLKGPMLFHLLYRIMPYSILKKIFFQMSPIAMTSYSNLGKIDERKLCFAGIEISEAFFVTATKPIPYFQLTVSSFRNQCTFTSCTSAGGDDLAMIEQLMDNIYKQFTEMVSVNQ